MLSITKKNFVFLLFLFSYGFYDTEYLAETNNNSIINLFCIENFREEMLKAKINYDKKIAKETCDCYLEEFLNSRSHQIAINKCKLETKKKYYENSK